MKIKFIVIDPTTSSIEKKEFGGTYGEIQDQLNGSVYHDTLTNGDLLFYEYPQEECESEDVTIVGSRGYKGKVVITGEPTKNSDQYNWRCKNVKTPMRKLKENVIYSKVDEVVFQ